MDDGTIARIRANASFQELVRKRSSFGWLLTAIMLLIYFSYIFTVAFAPEFLALPLSAGATTSLAIPVGILVILAAIGLTGIYVWRANREFDRLIDEIAREAR